MFYLLGKTYMKCDNCGKKFTRTRDVANICRCRTWLLAPVLVRDLWCICINFTSQKDSELEIQMKPERVRGHGCHPLLGCQLHLSEDYSRSERCRPLNIDVNGYLFLGTQRPVVWGEARKTGKQYCACKKQSNKYNNNKQTKQTTPSLPEYPCSSAVQLTNQQTSKYKNEQLTVC